MNWWQTLSYYWAEITTWTAVVDVLLVIAVIPWVLSIKKEPTSTIAWLLLVVFLPIIGVLLFILFGYQSVYRPLVRKRRHRSSFRATNPAGRAASAVEWCDCAGLSGVGSVWVGCDAGADGVAAGAGVVVACAGVAGAAGAVVSSG